jgi:hypothetical protein
MKAQGPFTDASRSANVNLSSGIGLVSYMGDVNAILAVGENTQGI